MKAAGSYCDFLFSDSEGSDLDENDSDVAESADATGDSYDAATEGIPAFDKRKGEDTWIGRRIIKTFGEHGNFCGIVYGVDNDAKNKGYRLFLVHYFDDPDDGEGMWPEELVK